MIKRILFGLLAAVALVTAVTGCRTVGGASENVELPAAQSNVPPPP